MDSDSFVILNILIVIIVVFLFFQISSSLKEGKKYRGILGNLAKRYNGTIHRSISYPYLKFSWQGTKIKFYRSTSSNKSDHNANFVKAQISTNSKGRLVISSYSGRRWFNEFGLKAYETDDAEFDECYRIKTNLGPNTGKVLNADIQQLLLDCTFRQPYMYWNKRNFYLGLPYPVENQREADRTIKLALALIDKIQTLG